MFSTLKRQPTTLSSRSTITSISFSIIYVLLRQRFKHLNSIFDFSNICLILLAHSSTQYSMCTINLNVNGYLFPRGNLALHQSRCRIPQLLMCGSRMTSMTLQIALTIRTKSSFCIQIYSCRRWLQFFWDRQ